MEKLIQINRLMAWERAKGELKSVLVSINNKDQYREMKAKIESFIKEVEDNALAE